MLYYVIIVDGVILVIDHIILVVIVIFVDGIHFEIVVVFAFAISITGYCQT